MQITKKIDEKNENSLEIKKSSKMLAQLIQLIRLTNYFRVIIAEIYQKLLHKNWRNEEENKIVGDVTRRSETRLNMFRFSLLFNLALKFYWRRKERVNYSIVTSLTW